jgi:hypothetical protein
LDEENCEKSFVKYLANPFTPNIFPGKKKKNNNSTNKVHELIIEKIPFNLDEKSIDLSMA